MKILFCNADGGDVLLEKDSSELKEILSSITREGTEINLYFGKDDFIHGYVNNIMYSYNKEDNEESLNIYIDEKFYDIQCEIRNKLDKINENIESIDSNMN